jgi:CheY-like chemotaxis protein
MLRKIRPDIRIVLTSGSEKEVEDLMEKSDVDGFVSKPFTTDKLLTIIHEVLEKD